MITKTRCVVANQKQTHIDQWFIVLSRYNFAWKRFRFFLR